MKIEQIYTGCLAQGAYYITSDGEAAIIDPLRETQAYIDRLENDQVKLKYVFETHFHADFVSGHCDLSAKTGAEIVFGPGAQTDFSARIAAEREVFTVGKISIQVLHTPGHTLESSCYLLRDENGKDCALFSGDTLFLGDVGRPDLAQKASSMSQEDLAGMLYDSLYGKILPLDDAIIVYPAHGAGSACGKNMMKETMDTLGNQKRVNYALNQASKSDFIAAVTDGLLAPPAYFGMNVALNKQGSASFDGVLESSLKGLTVDAFIEIAQDPSVVVLDTRPASEFAQAFVPNAINIGIQGDFAPWTGALLADVSQKILLICEPGMEKETVTRLARVGFDQVLGYLEGGMSPYLASGGDYDLIERMSALEFSSLVDLEISMIVDVRKASEFEAEHVSGAVNRPLSEIDSWIDELSSKNHFYLHCAGGYRSMIAASKLRARGVRHFTEIAGGYAAIKETDIERTNFVCSKIECNFVKN